MKGEPCIEITFSIHPTLSLHVVFFLFCLLSCDVFFDGVVITKISFNYNHAIGY